MGLKDSSTLLRLVEEDCAESVMSKKLQHPALAALVIPRWDDAFGVLHHASEDLLGSARAQTLLDALASGRRSPDLLDAIGGHPGGIRDAILDAVDALYAIG